VAASSTAPTSPAAPASPGVNKDALIADSLDAVKKFFSPRPLEASGGALGYTSPVWMALGGAHVAAILLLYIAMSAKMGGFFGTFFGYGLLTAAASFFVLSGGAKLIFVLGKIDMPFSRVMNLVSVAVLPITAAVLAGVVLTFINAQWGMFLAAAGILGGAACFYYIVRKTTDAAGAKSDPFWLVFGLLAVYLLVMAMLQKSMMESMLQSAFSSMRF